jgi:hypothetical protein
MKTDARQAFNETIKSEKVAFIGGYLERKGEHASRKSFSRDLAELQKLRTSDPEDAQIMDSELRMHDGDNAAPAGMALSGAIGGGLLGRIAGSAMKAPNMGMLAGGGLGAYVGHRYGTGWARGTAARAEDYNKKNPLPADRSSEKVAFVGGALTALGRGAMGAGLAAGRAISPAAGGAVASGIGRAAAAVGGRKALQQGVGAGVAGLGLLGAGAAAHKLAT